MDCFCLQEWITLKGGSGVLSINQGEIGWIDLAGYQDVVAWLDVREYSNGATNVTYQTAPLKDESLFVNMASVLLGSTGITVTPLIKRAMPSATPPLGRWFRWNVHVGSGTWDITFRIWVAANRIGGRQ